MAFNEFAFGKDLFIRTNNPVAADSKDDWSPKDQPELYHHMPLSFIADLLDGEEMARNLLKWRHGKDRFLDLGTGSGSVPYTMRRSGMKAIGLDGLDTGKKGLLKQEMFRYDHQRDIYGWYHAPEILETCDITMPFGIYDAEEQIQKFDWIYSSDCFEHLITSRVPTLVDNVWNHLADDGYGIFEIHIAKFHVLHQTVRPLSWWVGAFARRFMICDDLAAADFIYTRSYMKRGTLAYRDGRESESKVLLWVKKGNFIER